jgi:hypothetical protein
MLTVDNSRRGEGRGQNDPNLVVEMEQGGKRERGVVEENRVLLHFI